MRKYLDRTLTKDPVTGETTETEKTTRVNLDEPSYVKLYLDDIQHIFQLNTQTANVLYELFKLTAYNKHEISLSSGSKKIISNNIGITPAILNNCLTYLCKKNVINRLDVGLYVLNPYLFGFGTWKNIKELRNSYIEMKITYIDDKREIVSKLKKITT